MQFSRREFLGLATIVGTGAMLTSCTSPKVSKSSIAPSVKKVDAKKPAKLLFTKRGHYPQQDAPKGGKVLTTVPKHTVAWTVDDGVDADTVAAYVKYAKHTGLRLTFFVYGAMDSWRKHADILRPLVQSGQIQLGNHTWSHPDLTTLSEKRIEHELLKCEHFIQHTFGVNPRPFFRPPYGSYNHKVLHVARKLGYTVPCMWGEDLRDWSTESTSKIEKIGKRSFKSGKIVIGHANHNHTIHAISALGGELVHERELEPVTLKDVIKYSH